MSPSFLYFRHLSGLYLGLCSSKALACASSFVWSSVNAATSARYPANGYAFDEIYAEDVVFYNPSNGAYRGRGEIDRIAGAIKATYPDFSYQLIAEPEEVGDGGRVPWVSGCPGHAPAYAGTDFIIARDGWIAAIYLFFDKLP